MGKSLSVQWYVRDLTGEEDIMPREWCDLFLLDLQNVKVHQPGVYIIWRPSTSLPVVYVGQGENCAERLEKHKQDNRILAYREEGVLFVTWARVDGGEAVRERVERFLADSLNPLVGTHPRVAPLAVNLPRR